MSEQKIIENKDELLKSLDEGEFLGEYFRDSHHKIIDGLGSVLSSLGADSNIMMIFMSWGDTMNSQNTLDMLTECVKYDLNTLPQDQ